MVWVVNSEKVFMVLLIIFTMDLVRQTTADAYSGTPNPTPTTNTTNSTTNSTNSTNKPANSTNLTSNTSSKNTTSTTKSSVTVAPASPVQSTKASTVSVASNSTTNSSTASVIQTNFSYVNKGDDWTGTCQTGQLQSPINIQVVKGTCDNSMVLDVQFDMMNRSVTVVRTSNTIMSKGSFSNLYATDINGNLYGYTSQYMKFHSPSEHSISGSFYDMELQIYHQIKSDFSTSYTYTQAVLSILFQVSATDQPFFDTYNFGATSPISMNFTNLLGSQISENPTYYTYQGSQTVPGCSEIVNWYVLDTILPISASQLSSFTQYFSNNLTFANGNGNERDIQSVNNRLVKQGGVACQEQFVYFFSFFILYIFINYFIFKLL